MSSRDNPTAQILYSQSHRLICRIAKPGLYSRRVLEPHTAASVRPGKTPSPPYIASVTSMKRLPISLRMRSATHPWFGHHSDHNFWNSEQNCCNSSIQSDYNQRRGSVIGFVNLFMKLAVRQGQLAIAVGWRSSRSSESMGTTRIGRKF